VKGFKMRKLLWLLVAGFALYSGYWLIGARASEHGLEAWLEARAQDGWQSEYGALETRGYPLAFTSKITNLALADPKSGTAYATQHFTLETKSYAPTQIAAIFASSARVSTPYQHIELTNTGMRGALDVDVGTRLPLLSSSFELTQLAAQSDLGWGFALDQAHLATLRHNDDPLSHDITFTATDFAPSTHVMSLMDPSGLLSDRFETLSLSSTITFDAPWDITALEGVRPQPTSVALHDVTAQWGELSLRLAGDVLIDTQGYPDGSVQIKAQNWREMITLGIAAGAIPADLENLLLRGGELISGLKGNKDTLDAELTLANGMISLGFFPLGPAPRLHIR
jgi:hypothetical protein